MLIARPGLRKIYGRYDDEQIKGIYRRATILGDTSDFLWFQKIRVQKDLTVDQVLSGVDPFEFVYIVKRVLGDAHRIIDTIEIGDTVTNTVNNFCIAEDRHGRQFIFYGHGKEPRIYRPTIFSSTALQMGLPAPTNSPKVNPAGEGFFIESVDVQHSGGSYNKPPTISVEGGSPIRKAKLKTIIQNGHVVGVDVIDGGNGYKEAPRLEVDFGDMGGGFRGVGVVSTGSRKLTGFSEDSEAVIDSTTSGYSGQPSDSENYGTHNGTQNQFVMFQRDREENEVSVRPVSWQVNLIAKTASANYFYSTDYFFVDKPIQDLQIGDLVRMIYHGSATATVASGGSGWYTITDVDYSTNSFQADFQKGGSIGYSSAATYNFIFLKRKIQLLDSSGLAVGHRLRIPEAGKFIPITGYPNITTAKNFNGTSGFPSDSDYESSSDTSVLITAIDSATDIITLDRYVETHSQSTASGRALTSSVPTLTFGETVVGVAEAKYNSTTRRYTAIVPASSSSPNGSGASALMRFSPQAFSYALDDSSTSSVAVRDTGLDKHFNKLLGEQNNFTRRFSTFLYDDYWSGSDFDVQNSLENRQYGGLQAGGGKFTKGFSGSINGRPADVYWPDYTTLSVWQNTGVYSNSPSQWSREDATVQRISNDFGSTPYIEFQLKPSQSARTVEKIGRFGVQSSFAPEQDLPDAVPPTVRVYLRECPDTWRVSGGQSLPTAIKEKSTTRLAWFSGSSGLPTPIVDLPREDNGDGVATIQKTAVEIVDPGSGWVKGTVFSFRLYQANAYAQINDFNVAVSEPTKQANHQRYSATSRFVEFKLTANTADINTPHGPPATLLEPAFLGRIGDGYATGDGCSVTLLKRNEDTAFDPSGTGMVPALKASWTATELETLTSSNLKTITAVRILTGGTNYRLKPQVKVRNGGRGYGLSVTPTITDGRVTGIQINDPGRDYNEAPELYTDSKEAEVTPLMRSSLRGKYQCAYRYADRSETVIKETTVYRSAEKNALIMTDVDGIKPDMIVEGVGIPNMTRITSVNADQIELSEDVSDTIRESGRVLWESNAEQVVGTDFAEILTQGQTLTYEVYYYSPDEEYAVYITAGGNFILYKRSFIQQRRFQIPVYIDIVFQTNTNGNLYAFAALNTAGRFALWPADADIEDPDASPLYTFVSQGAELVRLWNGGYIDATSGIDLLDVKIRDLTKPIAYSDFSPLTDLDAGPNELRENASEIKWQIENPDPPIRADMVEFWRTSGDQSLVFYRAESYGLPSANSIEVVGTDILTDEELFDPDRPNYAAMPIVLPNGALNAYRFGMPRSDMEVAVAFQDRLWYGVSTSGEKVNTVFYSEFDEFESHPDLNELPIQQNQKSTDVLTGLVPFGSILLLMQHTHTYALTYNTDPAVDGTIQMMSHRGVLHQRCWDIHENILYAADESGVYAMTRNGEIRDISLPVREFFVGELINFGIRETFSLQTDPRTHILRFFCSLKTEDCDTPSFALCYDIQAQSWWTESYPNSITSVCTGRPDEQRINTMLCGAVDGNMYELDAVADHSNYSLTDTDARVGGSGYFEAPEITVPNCKAAKVQGVVSEGALVDVVIQNTGWDAKYGISLLTEDGKKLGDHTNKPLQGVEYAPIKLNVAPPPNGGIQAEAYAHYSVTPLVKRVTTVSQGEPYVRLQKSRVDGLEPDFYTGIMTESGLTLLTEEETPREIRTQPPAVGIGMEAIGEFIPLNSFVTHIDRNNVYLAHPDGTPVSILQGEPRTNKPGTTSDWLEEGGTAMDVEFKKPATMHVPLRAQTGFMQLVNEDNAKGGDTLADRSVSVVYTPTAGTKEIEILERFNGQQELRSNSIRRDRTGSGGFIHREDSASTVLNTDKEASHLGFSTGVAKAKFASRSNNDQGGTDQHLMVEVHGRPYRSDQWVRENFWVADPTVDTAKPVVIHNLTINGVIEDGQ